MFADLFSNVPNWALVALQMGLAVGVALTLHFIVYRIAAMAAKRTETTVDDSFVRRSRTPLRVIAALLALMLSMPTDGAGPLAGETLDQLLSLALTVGFGWLGIALTGVLVDYVAETYPMDVADNLRARQVHTQTVVIRRFAVALIAVVVLCILLINIPGAREIGISLFASAGVAGLVIGMAARPALSNLIAGLQIALTGPIHVDDVVIVEGEWGRIEEISSTYVVVRIWDQRRLVVPLSHFIEQPFQNWTRRSAEILGTVFLYADYTVPVDAVREKLTDIAQGSELWDGRVCLLQVTNATDKTVELRALVSAADASNAWDLRCHVREHLIAWLQAEYPESLPRHRAMLENIPDPDQGPR